MTKGNYLIIDDPIKVDDKSAAKRAKRLELTPKQEDFAQKFVDYGVASKAYREAYDTKTDSPATVWTSAYKTRVLPHVDLRIKELIKERKRSIHIDREKITLDILELIDNAKKFAPNGVKTDGSVILKAYEMLGKMHDLNEDAKEDRRITNHNKEALLENLKLRMQKDGK